MNRLKGILCASSRTVSENWKETDFVLLFVTDLNKMSGSLMSEQKVVSGASSLMLQCAILLINEAKHASKNKTDWDTYISGVKSCSSSKLTGFLPVGQ